ncbi:MAG TPA: diaminopimelate decarboxylase [Candidatus Paceibacterota bacterium]|jgi:diaminopimelate decarboxylase
MYTPSRAHAESVATLHGTPAFVTDASTLRAQVRKMRAAFGAETKLFYAVKANYNPHIVGVLKEAGIDGIDAVSPHEIRLALELGFTPDQVLYTPSNPSDDELRYAGTKGVLQNLGSLSEIRRFCRLFPNDRVSVRICPEVGAGEFEQVTTGNVESKFGIALSDVDEAKRICDAAGVAIVGIHCHIGSGFYEASALSQAMVAVAGIAERFEDALFIDLGGGFGVPYRLEQSEIDIEALAASARGTLADFTARTGRALTLYLEPGKYLVSASTVLLSRITTIKEKGGRTFVGLDTGFNHLVRPAMYGAYHHVVNLSKPEGEAVPVVVAGNLCETGDVMNRDIELASPEEGDLVALLVAGGYGSSMSSTYNMRGTAVEVLIDGDDLRLTKRRQTYEDLTGLFEPK